MKVKCKKNINHIVKKYNYISFSYYYCKNCKEEVSINDECLDVKHIEMEFNQKLLQYLNQPNVYFPEYFMIENRSNELHLIPIDRIENKAIKFSQITKITKDYVSKLLEEYKKRDIIFKTS